MNGHARSLPPIPRPPAQRVLRLVPKKNAPPPLPARARKGPEPLSRVAALPRYDSDPTLERVVPLALRAPRALPAARVESDWNPLPSPRPAPVARNVETAPRLAAQRPERDPHEQMLAAVEEAVRRATASAARQQTASWRTLVGSPLVWLALGVTVGAVIMYIAMVSAIERAMPAGPAAAQVVTAPARPAVSCVAPELARASTDSAPVRSHTSEIPTFSVDALPKPPPTATPAPVQVRAPAKAVAARVAASDDEDDD